MSDKVVFTLRRLVDFSRDPHAVFARDLAILKNFDAPLGILPEAEIDLDKTRTINGYGVVLTRFSIGKNRIAFDLRWKKEHASRDKSVFVDTELIVWHLRHQKWRGLEISRRLLEVFSGLSGYEGQIESWDWQKYVIDYHANVREVRGFWFHPDSKYHQIGIAPVHVWSDLFCRRAFGKSSLEIAERVRPVAKAVHLDEAGNVQVAFLDMDAEIPQILAMNERVRPLIGGYGMFAPFPDDCSGIEGVVTHAPDEKPKPRQEAIMADSELDSMAQAYLDSLQHGCDIEGGVLEGEALSRLTLDYSLDSLDRIDNLLIRIAASRKPAELDVARTEVQNLSFLVGFYAGATLSKVRETRPTWKVHAEIAQVDPAFAQQVPLAFETYLVCCIGADRFFPLVAVRHLLEQGVASPKRLRSSVEAFL